MGVAVTGGCLYAVGGSDGVIPLASVERWVSNECSHSPHCYQHTGLTLSLDNGVKWPLYSARGNTWVWLFITMSFMLLGGVTSTQNSTVLRGQGLKHFSFSPLSSVLLLDMTPVQTAGVLWLP